jgi:hypothetical protein
MVETKVWKTAFGNTDQTFGSIVNSGWCLIGKFVDKSLDGYPGNVRLFQTCLLCDLFDLGQIIRRHPDGNLLHHLITSIVIVSMTNVIGMQAKVKLVKSRTPKGEMPARWRLSLRGLSARNYPVDPV